MKNNYCIIMAGGIGSRFWPLSTTKTPKQFLDILGIGKSLLRLTFERMIKVCPVENFYIVTNQSYEKLVLQQLPELKPYQVLKEPMRRNTAPCIAYGNYEIKKRNPNANIIVTPSDHLILNEQSFISIVQEGLEAVKSNDYLLTIGIKPSRPDTGYGYIQIGKMLSNNNHIINKVKTFTEKPELEMAKTFLKSGDFFWNSGIFMWSLSSIDAAFKSFLPQVYTLFDEELKDSRNPNLLDNIYSKCQNISIDYGIMEKSDNVYMIQSDFGWSDLGTWGALYENSIKDSTQNAIIGKNVMVYDSSNCMISVPQSKIAVIEGLHDFIVVDSGECLLICKKSDEQRIRQFVNDIKLKKGDSYV
jgi:mannose-1-phosphate guanylyltransferase